MDLFTAMSANQDLPGTPLPEKMRPRNLDAWVGQTHVISQLQRYLKAGSLPSMIFWGPPGTGKTTLAQILASKVEAEFVAINAVESGAKALKEIGEAARDRRLQFQRKTLLFVDEIHRFNKAQQDVLLPYVEKGELILVGATTENPSYELNRALLSRCRLITFERHSEEHLRTIVFRALEKMGLTWEKIFEPEAENEFLAWVDGDARRALLALDELVSVFAESQKLFTPEALKETLGRSPLGYDKSSDQHYDSISAFIKSIRGSDVDAALYYLARMLKGGEDPVFISRRLVILASEDVGNADPRALQVAIAGAQAVELIGLPEGAINLAQVVTYLASSPKSNRSYMALKKAQAYVETTGTASIPLAMRSAKTPAMKDLGYGKDYLYPHDFPRHWVEQDYWPEGLPREDFYQPSEVGFEKQIREYQTWLKGQNKR